MTNAKEELLSSVKDNKVKCATIKIGNYEDEDEDEVEDVVLVILKCNHTTEEYNDFLENLDLCYDDDYGIQNLFGTVWFEDNTWLSRGEYDGREWWEHKILPEIPKECV